MANEFIARRGLIALEDSQITGSLTISGDLSSSAGNTGSFDRVETNTLDVDLLDLVSTQTDTSPLRLTADSLNDNVGALRINGSQPDVYLNQTGTSFTTVTFARGDQPMVGFGKNSSDNLYFFRETGQDGEPHTYDNTGFEFERSTGNISLGYSLDVNNHITASNISSSGQIYANAYLVNGLFGLSTSAGNDTVRLGFNNNTSIQLGKGNNPTLITGNVTASGNISASGDVIASNLIADSASFSTRVTTNDAKVSYTDAAVKTKLNTDNVVSASGNFTNNEFIVAVGTNAVTSSDALAVDSDGNLGIGTPNPEVRLHMLGEAAQTTQILMEQFNDTADAPDIRTRRYRGTSASRADVQTGDYLFRLNVHGQDGGNSELYGSMRFDVDGSDQDAMVWGLQTRDTGGTVADRITIDSSGDVDIAGNLSIDGFSDVSASLAAAVAGGDNLGNHTATQDLNMDGNNITSVGDITSSGAITASGDIRTHGSLVLVGGSSTSRIGFSPFGSITDQFISGFGNQITIDGDNYIELIADNEVKINAPKLGIGTIYANDNAAQVPEALTITGNISASGDLTIQGFTSVSASLASAVAGGDDLGNHTATQDLNMGSNNITSVGNVDGVDVSTLKSDFDTLEGKTLLSGSAQIASDISGAFTAGNGISLSSGQFTVAAGTGLTQNAGGLAFDADGGTLTTSNADVDHILINDGGTFKRITKGNINVGDFNNDAGYLIPADTASFLTTVAFSDVTGKPALISSSAQVDHDATTNFSADEHFTQANITTVGTVTSGDISTILPSGTVSGSSQILPIATSSITDFPTEVSRSAAASGFGAGGGGGAVSAVANGADDRIATFSSTDALNGESALTFDGTKLLIDPASATANAVLFEVSVNGDQRAFIDEDGDASFDGYVTAYGLRMSNDGAQSSPALAFGDDVNTGIYQPADNQIAIQANGGTAELTVSTAGVNVAAGDLGVNQTIEHIGDTDTKIDFTTNNISLEAGGTQGLELDTTGSTLPNVKYNIYDTASAELGAAGGAIGDIVKFGDTTTSAGFLYYLKQDGTWGATNAGDTSASTGSLAVSLGTNSTTDGMLLRGMANLSSGTGGTGNGQPIYLSTAGGRVQSAAPSTSGNVSRIVGHVMNNSNNLIYFNPSNDWIVID